VLPTSTTTVGGTYDNPLARQRNNACAFWNKGVASMQARAQVQVSEGRSRLETEWGHRHTGACPPVASPVKAEAPWPGKLHSWRRPVAAGWPKTRGVAGCAPW